MPSSIRIRIRRTVEDTEVEVDFESKEDFEIANSILKEICRRVRVEHVVQGLQIFWEKCRDEKRISELTEDKGLRIILSLLDSWPETKNSASIESDTGLSYDDVYNYVHGRAGEIKDLILEKDGSWLLADAGIQYCARLASEQEKVLQDGSRADNNEEE